jgi:hypothetical protein
MINGGQKKDYTTEIPMVELEEAIRFVTKIHNTGLETASMPEIAKASGYKTPSSTPFYRRMVASRQFGLLSKSGADLTVRVKDYLKPDSEGADRRALVDAVLGIPPYAEIVQRHDGKKLNISLVANGLSKALDLTDSCALLCAKVFAASLKFAGLLASDMTVSLNASESQAQTPSSSQEIAPSKEGDKPEIGETLQTQGHTIYLDKSKTRKFTVNAPIDITSGEIERIKKWLDYALIVDAENEEVKI